MKNVVILGAGPAGLTAGYEILRRMGSDYTVTIIERNQYIGGLCRTVNVGTFRFDIGGHRYFTDNEQIISWWNQFMEKTAFTEVQRFSHIVYQGQMIQYPIRLSPGEMRMLGVNKILRIVLDYMKAQRRHMPIESLEDFYISRFGKELYHTFFESYTEKVCGQHPAVISPAWGYRRVGGLSISRILFGCLGIRSVHSTDMRSTTDCFYYPKYGSGELWNNVAEEIIHLGGQIITNESIENLNLSENRISSVKCNDGRALSVDYLFSSIPIPDLLSIIPNVPPQETSYGKELSYRDITVVSFLFPINLISSCLINTGKLIPDQWLYIQDKERKVSRIQLLNNWSKSLINEDTYVGLSLEYYTSISDEMSTMTDNDWIHLSLSELINLGYICNGTLPSDQAVFHQDKAYPCYHGGYCNLEKIHQYLEKINNLACIGRNGQHHYSNIDHAMESAFRAVDWIEGKCKKTDIWFPEQCYEGDAQL